MSELDKNSREAIKKVLQDEGDLIVLELLSRMASEDANATGKTSKSLRSKVSVLKRGEINFDIVGGEGWKFVEQGRGKTKSSTKGQPPLIESIKKWMRARGIRPEGGTKGFNSLAFVITRRIHQEGTLINRLGERRDIYSSVVTQERIDKIINKIAVAGEVEMLTDLIALYKLK